MSNDKNNSISYNWETAEAFAKQINDFKQQVDKYQKQCSTYYKQNPDEYTEEVQKSLEAQNKEYAQQLALYEQRYNDYCAVLNAQEAKLNISPKKSDNKPSEIFNDYDYIPNLTSQPPAKPDPTGTLLDDIPYDDSNRQRSSLDDITAPVIEYSRYDDSNRKRSSLDDIPAPKLQKISYVESGVPLSAQLDAIAPPKLESTVPYVESDKKKSIDDIAAPILMDMSDEIKPVYVRKETEDERRAKEESKKATVRTRTAMESAPQTDKEESLRMYRALKAEQEAEIAKKGLKLIFVVAGFGIVLAVCIYMFFARIELSVESGFLDKLREYSPYFAGAVGLFSLLNILRLGFAKTFSSILYILNAILMLASITLLANCTNKSQVLPFFAGALILSIFLCFFINTSDSIDKFFKRKDTNIRY